MEGRGGGGGVSASCRPIWLVEKKKKMLYKRAKERKIETERDGKKKDGFCVIMRIGIYKAHSRGLRICYFAREMWECWGFSMDKLCYCGHPRENHSTPIWLWYRTQFPSTNRQALHIYVRIIMLAAAMCVLISWPLVYSDN